MGVENDRQSVPGFPYFGHGLGSASSNLQLYLWFAQAPGQADKKAVKRAFAKRGLGKLLGPKDWVGSHLLVFLGYGSDGFTGLVKYNPDYDRPERPAGWDFLDKWDSLKEVQRQLTHFEHGLDQTLAEVHESCPIEFALRVHGRFVPSPRHVRSIAAFDSALETIRALGASPDGPKGVGLASIKQLYMEALTLRLSKRGGAALPLDHRRQHLEALVGLVSEDNEWDLLKLALRLKAASGVELLERLPEPVLNTLWEDTKGLLDEGTSMYSAAAFKLDAKMVDWLRTRFDP